MKCDKIEHKFKLSINKLGLNLHQLRLNRNDILLKINKTKAVKFSFFISSSILHVGRDPGPASDKHGILRKSWQCITFYTDKLQKYC